MHEPTQTEQPNLVGLVRQADDGGVSRLLGLVECALRLQQAHNGAHFLPDSTLARPKQEKPQPTDVSYVTSLKAALVDAGFADTKIVVMDGQWDTDLFNAAANRSELASAVSQLTHQFRAPRKL